MEEMKAEWEEVKRTHLLGDWTEEEIELRKSWWESGFQRGYVSHQRKILANTKTQE